MKDVHPLHLDPAFLLKWNRATPRYTSYPTAPQFYPLGLLQAESALKRFDETERPLSVYIHIPFCRSMCLFCGCSVILNRRPEKQTAYVDLLCREIEQTAQRFSKRRRVTQLALGGGTPTMLTEEEFSRIFEQIHRVFEIDDSSEISIEIDPRTVFVDRGKKLAVLKSLGVNRVSFGVQDLDWKVQEVTRRRQSEEMTLETFRMAKEIGFRGINLDLIYGLPYQSVESFSKTAKRIAELKPDRIALFSYAKVPWLKEHQKAMPEEKEPTPIEKFQIYVQARAIFIEAGYQAIGMDHFSLAKDPMTKAYFNKTLWRNFQGYSLKLAEDMIGFGVTSIGYIDSAYLQNVKEIGEYSSAIQANRLPIQKGFLLSQEDLLRRWVIQRLMCHFELDKREVERQFAISFDQYFSSARPKLDELKRGGLLEETQDHLLPTPIGKLLVRLIASAFDAYLQPNGRYSKSI